MPVEVIHADARDALLSMPDASIDACVTDPPYALVSIVKRYGADGAAPANDRDGVYKRASAGFMGKRWDTGDTAFDPAFWRDVLRVLKPGAHLIAFGGTRTQHRLVCAIEDAGFEIRDALAWVYSQGFPKSHSLKNVLCSCGGDTFPYDQAIPQHDLRSVQRSDLPPAVHDGAEQGEVLLARMSESRVPSDRPEEAITGNDGAEQPRMGGRHLHRTGQGLSPDPCAAAPEGAEKRLRAGAHSRRGEDAGSPADGDGGSSPHQRQASGQQAGEPEGLRGPHGALDGGALRNGHACPRCGRLSQAFQGFGTALKPAFEFICLARKPLAESTIAANVMAHGTGALNIDGCRIATEGEVISAGLSDPANRPGVVGQAWQATGDKAKNQAAQLASLERANTLGRWPANVIHDGSEEVVEAFPESESQRAVVTSKPGAVSVNGAGLPSHTGEYGFNDSGSAARFFYSAKADAADRLGSKHPTVKPVDLMAYLIRLVTPKGGLVLDPFAGSGTTGMAAMREGMRAVLIEREAEYVADIRRRIAHVSGLDAPLFTSGDERAP